MSDDGSQKCVQSVEFLVRAYSEWRSPACDWERAELRNTFCKNHPELKLKQLGDVDDLVYWLDTNHPRRR